jgi:glutamyl-tRNA synthetase
MTSNDPPLTIGRLAPSPTGGLHLGHARTFLAAWLSARSSGGRIVLRIEDLDATRVRPGAARGAIDDLRWLGLDWDEGPDVGGRSAPYVQTERLELYRDALERLKSDERVYPCTCTRAEIARASSAPHAEDEGPTYPGTCARRSAADANGLGDAPFAWRFRVPGGPVAWIDRFQGSLAVHPSEVGGDFIVARQGHGPAYQLAVVVDDAAMRVTEVIRGQDLVTSTPRQILLGSALGWVAPAFGHIPLVVGPDGRRLAKRDGSIKLATLREAGVDPRRLIGWLARSLGMTKRLDPSTPADWPGRFAPASVPTTPFVVRPGDLAELIEGQPTREA